MAHFCRFRPQSHLRQRDNEICGSPVAAGRGDVSIGTGIFARTFRFAESEGKQNRSKTALLGDIKM